MLDLQFLEQALFLAAPLALSFSMERKKKGFMNFNSLVIYCTLE